MAFKNLSASQIEKKGEFYTDLKDIQHELNNYTDKFKNKVVFCNCDDPFESNFVKYFLINFNRLGLKELIAAGYKAITVDGAEIGQPNTPYALRVKSTSSCLVRTQKDLDMAGAKYFLETERNKIMTPLTGNMAIDSDGNQIKADIEVPVLDNNNEPVLNKKGKPKVKKKKIDLYYEAGDFRSDMSIELLKEADIVVTNPPFFLFREYVAQLIKYNKKFLIIGNQNAITYKEIFPLIKNNKLWLGYGFDGNVGFFKSPYEDKAKSNQHQKGKIRVSGVMWFTNIDHLKRHQMMPLDLGCQYNGHEKSYPKYDNYDAIHINTVTEIPCDYKGVIGVPITFLTQFSPEQFEIIGLSSKENKGDVKRFHDNSYYSGYTRGKVVTRIESNMPILDEESKKNSKTKRGTLCQKSGEKNLYQLYWRIFIKFTDTYIQKNSEQFNKGNS